LKDHGMDVINRPPASAENTAKKQQRGRPFEPGKSGNPKGRPRGSRNKASLAAEALLEGEADAIIRKVVEKAKQGDPTALRLCLERLLPPRRDRPVAFDLPKIESTADVIAASSSVVAACAEGALSPDEAARVMNLINLHAQTLEQTERKWVEQMVETYGNARDDK
jgi:hypothetical protein